MVQLTKSLIFHQTTFGGITTHPKYKYQIKTELTKGTNKGRNKGRSWWTIHFKMTDAKREILYGDHM